MADTYIKILGKTIVAGADGLPLTSTTVGNKQALDVNVTGGDIIIDNPTIIVDINAFGATPDSVLIVGSQDGTTTGTRHVLEITSAGNLRTDSSDTVQPVSGPLTNAELRVSAVEVTATDLDIRALTFSTDEVDVSGSSVSVSNFPATQPVSGTVTVVQPTGTNLHTTIDNASIAVTGPLTDTQLRATVVPVSLSSTTITGSVAVTGPLTDAQLRATPVPVSGTVATGGLTDAQLRASAVPVSLSSTTIIGSVAVTGPLTDGQLRATAVPISGTITANAGSGTMAVSAVVLPLPSGAATAALQTQPGVDIGDVTVNNASGVAAVNIQDGGNSITVDGTFWQATQPVSIAASVAVTGPLTDTQLRATAVPISGTVSTGGLTDAQLRATPVPVSGSISSTGAVVTASSNLTGVQTLEIDLSTSQGTIIMNVLGTWAGTLFSEGTVDGSNWFQVNVTDYSAVDGQVSLSITTTDKTYAANAAGLKKFRIRAVITGTASVAMAASASVSIVTANQSVQFIDASSLPLPTGAATSALQTQPGVDIGDVTVNNASGAGAVNIQDGGNSITVDGTFWQVTQPVSIAASVAVTGPLTDAQLRATPVPVSGTVSTGGLTDTQLRATPVPVSGTVTANAGTNLNTSLLALETTQTAGNVLVGAVNETAPASDTANSGLNGRLQRIAQRLSSLITAIGSPFQAGGSIGNTTFASTQSGTWTVQPGNTANTTAWKVDASSVAVPITDNGGSLTVDNGGTFAVQATIAAAATSIGKAEDSVAADGDVGVPSLAIRKAAPANLSNADGDYEILQISAGRLWASATIDAALPAGTNAIGKLSANSGVDIGDVDVTSIAAGTNRLGSVRLVDSSDADLTAVKGSQTSRAVGTQDLKDAGRTAIIFSAVAAAAGLTTVETAISLTKSAGTAATSSANSFVITSGKTFRITAISVATRANAVATAQATTFNLRLNTAGAVTTSSTPILLSLRSATAATASAWDRVQLAVPDGFEIAGNGTIQIGITAAAAFVANAPTWDVTIIGYEY